MRADIELGQRPGSCRRAWSRSSTCASIDLLANTIKSRDVLDATALDADCTPLGLGPTDHVPLERSGFLIKKSGMLSGLHRRFFMLQYGTLFWYRSETDDEPAGLCNLRDVRIGVQASLGSSGRPALTLRGRKEIVLIADDEQERDAWLRALRHNQSQPPFGLPPSSSVGKADRRTQGKQGSQGNSSLPARLKEQMVCMAVTSELGKRFLKEYCVPETFALLQALRRLANADETLPTQSGRRYENTILRIAVKVAMLHRNRAFTLADKPAVLAVEAAADAACIALLQAHRLLRSPTAEAKAAVEVTPTAEATLIAETTLTPEDSTRANRRGMVMEGEAAACGGVVSALQPTTSDAAVSSSAASGMGCGWKPFVSYADEGSGTGRRWPFVSYADEGSDKGRGWRPFVSYADEGNGTGRRWPFVSYADEGSDTGRGWRPFVSRADEGGDTGRGWKPFVSYADEGWPSHSPPFVSYADGSGAGAPADEMPEVDVSDDVARGGADTLTGRNPAVAMDGEADGVANGTADRTAGSVADGMADDMADGVADGAVDGATNALGVLSSRLAELRCQMLLMLDRFLPANSRAALDELLTYLSSRATLDRLASPSTHPTVAADFDAMAASIASLYGFSGQVAALEEEDGD